MALVPPPLPIDPIPTMAQMEQYLVELDWLLEVGEITEEYFNAEHDRLFGPDGTRTRRLIENSP